MKNGRNERTRLLRFGLFLIINDNKSASDKSFSSERILDVAVRKKKFQHLRGKSNVEYSLDA